MTPSANAPSAAGAITAVGGIARPPIPGIQAGTRSPQGQMRPSVSRAAPSEATMEAAFPRPSTAVAAPPSSGPCTSRGPARSARARMGASRPGQGASRSVPSARRADRRGRRGPWQLPGGRRPRRVRVQRAAGARADGHAVVSRCSCRSCSATGRRFPSGPRRDRHATSGGRPPQAAATAEGEARVSRRRARARSRRRARPAGRGRAGRAWRAGARRAS